MDAPPRSTREVKVQIPVRLATALHARKILTGQQIGQMIEEALRAYYAQQDATAPYRPLFITGAPS